MLHINKLIEVKQLKSMVFMDCAWMTRTLEKSLDDVLSARDEEVIKELVLRLLAYYARQSDNAVDDMLVELVRVRLMTRPLDTVSEKEGVATTPASSSHL